MHSETFTLQQFFDAYQQRLELQWLTKSRGENRTLSISDKEGVHHPLVGHLNFIRPHLIELLGQQELHYPEELGKNSQHDTLQQLFNGRTKLIVISGGLTPPAQFVQQAESASIPVCSSPLESTQLASNIDYYLRSMLADTLVVHGVFMEVMGVGVLITGKSAIGKSELALELITRGHRLIADDAPAFRRQGPETLVGHCPKSLQNFLEVRGLGVMNVRKLFGDNAVRPDLPLQLIVHLATINDGQDEQLDRLNGTRRQRNLLEVYIPEVEIPVAPGRNLAVLVETAVRNQILYNQGYDAAREFMAQHQQMLSANKP